MTLKTLPLAVTLLLSAFTSQAQNPVFDSTKSYRLTNRWQGEKKSLDILNDGKNNDRPRLENSSFVSGQAWKITPSGNGLYKLSTVWQGRTKVLDVINDGNNTKLQLTNDGAYSGQFWRIMPGDSNYFRLSNLWQAGKSIDIINDGKNNNEPALASNAELLGQYWKIIPFSDVKTITVTPTEEPVVPAALPVFKNLVPYRITNSWAATNGNSLDVVNDGKKDKVQLFTTGAVSGQYWTLTPIPGYAGYYRLTNLFLGNDLSLDIINDDTDDKISFSKTAMTSGQAWKITPLGDGSYRLTSNFQGDAKSLDVINDGKNTKLHLAKTMNVSGQRWIITEIKTP